MEQTEGVSSCAPLLGSHHIPFEPHELSSQTLHFPTPVLRDMEKYASRLDRSVSWCARMAWSIACGEIASADALARIQQSRLLSGRKRPVRIELPMSTWLHVTMEAEQLDRSRSWLLTRSWLLARPRLLAAMR